MTSGDKILLDITTRASIVPGSERCFACDRTIRTAQPEIADTRDG